MTDQRTITEANIDPTLKENFQKMNKFGSEDVEKVSRDIATKMERNGFGNTDSSTISNFLGYWENLVNIESKADLQIHELQSELKQSEKEINNLKIQIGDIQREVIVKGSCMERLQAELAAAYKESEFVRKKLKRMEEELDLFKQKNSDLTDELNRKTEAENENDYWKVIELENEVKEQALRIKDLEKQITSMRLERDELKKTLDVMTAEQEEERKLVQEALDEAVAEKYAIQEKFEREFEKLRSVNCDREQKMLDDFEWKLREVESACKKRLDDKEQSSKQLIREIEGKLIIAEGKLAQFPHLKQCEQDLNHLKEKCIEQSRALRSATKQTEHLQNAEKILQDEIKHLKTQLEREKLHLTTIQAIHNREIEEKERKLQFKLDQQKTELNSEWDERLKKDTRKIKTELERLYRTEKQSALDEMKHENEEKVRQIRSIYEINQEDKTKEIEHLKHKLVEKEEAYKRELNEAQTESDRNIFELRRKLDKIDISYQEKIEKIQEKHEKEIERINDEAEKKIQQCELNWQAQVGSSRTTIELVKEQMQREAQEQLQELSERHRQQLEEQWDQLIQERDETISLMEQKHRTSMEKLRAELDNIYKSRNSRESETTEIDNNAEIDFDWIYVWNSREQELEVLHQGQIKEMNDRHRKEIAHWQNNVEDLQKRVVRLTKSTNETHLNEMLKKIEDLQKQLQDKDQIVARLNKEKHHHLELMNKDPTSTQTRQRRRGARNHTSSSSMVNQPRTAGTSSKSHRRNRGPDNSMQHSQNGRLNTT